jgi:hypothetical protein
LIFERKRETKGKKERETSQRILANHLLERKKKKEKERKRKRKRKKNKKSILPVTNSDLARKRKKKKKSILPGNNSDLARLG